MSAKDKFHEEVKRSLIKDQWTVTDDPLILNQEENGLRLTLVRND